MEGVEKAGSELVPALADLYCHDRHSLGGGGGSCCSVVHLPCSTRNNKYRTPRMVANKLWTLSRRVAFGRQGWGGEVLFFLHVVVVRRLTTRPREDVGGGGGGYTPRY